MNKITIGRVKNKSKRSFEIGRVRYFIPVKNYKLHFRFMSIKENDFLKLKFNKKNYIVDFKVIDIEKINGNIRGW